MTTTAVEKATGFIKIYLRAANTNPRVMLGLHGENSVNVYAQVKDGRGPRTATGAVAARLPIIGSRELSRLGDDLDRERAETVVVFTVDGKINGVLYEDVTIWIIGDQVTLPTLFAGTDKARGVLYELGRKVRDAVVKADTMQAQAWDAHLLGVINRAKEYHAYLNAVVESATKVSAHSLTTSVQ
jgi:hypothetical protein